MSSEAHPFLASTNSTNFESMFGQVPNIRDASSRNIYDNTPKPLPSLACRRHSGATASSGTSPTSTINSSSLTSESSPNSSPDSPNSLSSIRILNMATAVGESAPRPMSSGPVSSHSGFGLSSPMKKPRNMKNLSVNTNNIKTLSTSSLPRMGSVGTNSTETLVSTKASTRSSQAFSAPASPSFIVPIIPARKKMSNLGLLITTPESGTQRRLGGVPETPSFGAPLLMRPNLSRPDRPPMESLFSPVGPPEGGMLFPFSPTGAPEGGMQLPPFEANASNSPQPERPALNLKQQSFDSSNDSPVVRQTIEHVRDEFDHDLPQSREVKSPSYPEGPVCIYPPSVYLYLEPNDVEASKFDVVINVAREVVNPFELAAQKAAPKYRDMGVQVNMFPGQTANPNPQPALESTTILDIPDEYVDAPETPKAAKSGPEYIHKPWDHNTPVAVELLELCQLVEDRVKKGKKVLIHCQCGVSRSACLIIAYGLYQNPSLSVLEAYDAAKERSRWINPNMFFMYELNDFKNILSQKMPHKIAKAAVPRPGPKMGLTRTQTDSVVPSTLHTSFKPMTPLKDEPASAPLEHEGEILDQQPAEPVSPAFVGQDSVQATEISLPPILPSNPSTLEGGPSLRAASALKPLPLKAKPSLTINTPSPPLPSVTRPNDTLLSTIEPTLNLPQLRPTTFSPPPQRTLRPMPSLPAGFSSSLLSRRITPIPALPTPTMTPTLSFPALRPAHISVNPIGHPPLIALTQATPLTGTSHEHIAAPPELMSPRAMEFTASPFHRHVAGDVMSPVGSGPGLGFWDRLVARQKSEGRTAEDGKRRERKADLPDPRSPANVGGAPIVRSIDEVL